MIPRTRSLSGSLPRVFNNLRGYLTHRRIVMFWAVALAGLTIPWVAVTPSAVETPGKTCDVVSIYDGDTMTVRCQGKKVKVRFYCIDAPEMGQKPWGRQARDYLRQLVTSDQVTVVAKDWDRFGRTVGEVWQGDQNLNLELVRAGKVVVYPKYCSERQYFEVERQASEVGGGVWSEKGIQQTPWVWRRKI